MSHFESVDKKVYCGSTAIYISEQVCIGWHRTGAYDTAKLTFFHDFPVKVWGVYCTGVRIIFKFLPYESQLFQICKKVKKIEHTLVIVCVY